MNDQENCIICKEFFTTSNPPSKEHIIPEFLGGALILDKCVCRKCNSNMGKDFEGRLANNTLFKMQRYTHRIRGKDGDPSHPFSGKHVLEDGTKIHIDKTGKLEVITRFDDSINTTSSEFKFKLILDEKNTPTIEKTLSKKIKRIRSERTSDYDIQEKIKQAISESKLQTKAINNTSIDINFHIDINDLELLYLKIAYEILFLSYGENFLNNPIATVIATSLKNMKAESTLHISVLNEDDPILRNIFSEEYHWIYIFKNIVYIQLFSMAGTLQYTEKNLSELGVERVFRFCYKTATVEEIDLNNLILNHSKSDDFYKHFNEN